MRTLAQFIFGSQKNRIKSIPTSENTKHATEIKEQANMPKQIIKENGQSTIEEYYASQPKPTEQEQLELELSDPKESQCPPTTPTTAEKRSLSRGNSDGRNPKKIDNRRSNEKLLSQSTPSKEGNQKHYEYPTNNKQMMTIKSDSKMTFLDAADSKNLYKRYIIKSKTIKNNHIPGDFTQYRDINDFDDSLTDAGNVLNQQAFEQSLREAAADNGKENVQPDLDLNDQVLPYKIPKKNNTPTNNQESNNALEDIPSDEGSDCSFVFDDPDIEQPERTVKKANSWSKFIKVGLNEFNDQQDMTQPLYETIKKWLDKKAVEQAAKDGDADKKGSKWVKYHHGEIIDFKEPDGTINVRHIYMNCMNEAQFDWNMRQLKAIQKTLKRDGTGKQIFIWGQGVADKTYMCTFTIRDSRWAPNKKESAKAHERRILPLIMAEMGLSEFIDEIKPRGIHTLKIGDKKENREPIVKGIKMRANVYGNLATKILAWQEPPREVVTCGHVRVSYFIQTQSID